MKQKVWPLKKQTRWIVSTTDPKIKNTNWSQHPKNNKETLAAHKFDYIDEGSRIYQDIEKNQQRKQKSNLRNKRIHTARAYARHPS